MSETRLGFLLLTSHLGNPERRPLSTAQLRELTYRIRMNPEKSTGGELTQAHLIALGYSPEDGAHIVELLSENDLLQNYLRRGAVRKCLPLTRQDPAYPLIVRKRLGTDSPGCLWTKGDGSLLGMPAVSLVGSRELHDENRRFAEEVGRLAAQHNFVLVSGNARGADTAAQEACLSAGGKVISIVADALHSQIERENVLYISEEDYDMPFSAQRALRRNRVVHSMGILTFVAQCTAQKGGTWKGTEANLRKGWSSVYCYDDGSTASKMLRDMGARLIGFEELRTFPNLEFQEKTIFDMENPEA